MVEAVCFGGEYLLACAGVSHGRYSLPLCLVCDAAVAAMRLVDSIGKLEKTQVQNLLCCFCIRSCNRTYMCLGIAEIWMISWYSDQV